jgi:hypothetical protein
MAWVCTRTDCQLQGVQESGLETQSRAEDEKRVVRGRHGDYFQFRPDQSGWNGLRQRQ